jgi:site-specific DNA-methyltransferase (adenine-specific)
MRQLEDGSVQLIWTDPPYGTDRYQKIQSTGKKYRDDSVDDVVKLMKEVADEAVRVLSIHGVLAVCLDYRAVHQVYCALLEAGLHPHGEIIWTFGLGRTARKWWANKHNTILLFSKSSTPLFLEDEVPRVERKAPKGEYQGDKKVASVWDITFNSTNAERTGYPNQKPEKLIEPFIKVHTREGDLVVDPFGGSGTTAAVAKRLGRRYAIGDANIEAVNVIKDRLGEVCDCCVARYSVEPPLECGLGCKPCGSCIGRERSKNARTSDS